MSLPATEQPHNCETCIKNIGVSLVVPDSVFACHRKRVVREGYCTAWSPKNES
jgi:hypothetical protein